MNRCSRAEFEQRLRQRPRHKVDGAFLELAVERTGHPGTYTNIRSEIVLHPDGSVDEDASIEAQVQAGLAYYDLPEAT